ncbi:MAG: hypothetical protein ACK2U2_05615 [Anaerolineae bacterium]
MDRLLEMMEEWSKGRLLERRAVVASLCEPRLLTDPERASRVLGLLHDITQSILTEDDRRSEAFKVLRKGLAYGWSVVVAAQPSLGKPYMERWIRSQDPDIRWIMRQNLKKKRLLRVDEAWVSAQLVALES